MSVQGTKYGDEAFALVKRLAAESDVAPAAEPDVTSGGGSHSMWFSDRVSAMSPPRRRSRSPRERIPTDAIERAKATRERRLSTAGTRVQDVSVDEMKAELNDADAWVTQAEIDNIDLKIAKAYRRQCTNRLSAKVSRKTKSEVRRAESLIRQGEQERLAFLEEQVATLRAALEVEKRRAVRAEEESAALAVQLTNLQEGLASEAAASPHFSAMQGGGSRFTV